MDEQLRLLGRKNDFLTQAESFNRRLQLQRMRPLFITELCPGDVIEVGPRRKPFGCKKPGKTKNIPRFGGFQTPVRAIVVRRKSSKEMAVMILPGNIRNKKPATANDDMTLKVIPMRVRPFTLLTFQAEITLGGQSVSF